MNLPLEHYLVGGAVRDRLLGFEVTERDWVVVGATEQQMLDLGFRPVGRQFPVFLHPETQEEYALARTERKAGRGHTGFICDASPDVTLAEDLERRDLTINAIAMAEDGTLFDPCGGQADLEARVLRHVSPAFREDPLRVLRVARFLARFNGLGFNVAKDTSDLCAGMVKDGELQELSSERICQEMVKALTTDSPVAFFRFLDDVGAAGLLWPEITPAAEARLAATRLAQPAQRYALLMADATASEVEVRSRTLRVTNEFRELAVLTARHGRALVSPRSLDATAIVALLTATDSRRKPARFSALLEISGELGGSHPEDWLELAGRVNAISGRDVASDGVEGADIRRVVQTRQVRIVSDWQQG